MQLYLLYLYKIIIIEIECLKLNNFLTKSIISNQLDDVCNNVLIEAL